MGIFRKKGEEPTAKDSKIEELTLEVKQLRSELIKSYDEISSLIRETKDLNHTITMQKIKLSGYETKEEKNNNNLNLNLNYDGIHKY
jgi:predicted RNase H-like nuclease (RuvC/YqgF family)